MGIAERKEREKKELRDRILDTALELVSEEGLESLTMRKLADKIEYSATAIYAHFADKDSLLIALCKREFQGLADTLVGVELPTEPLERLRVLGRAYARFALENAQAYRLMFLLPGMPSRYQHAEGEVDAYGICVEGVRQARAAGVLREDAPDDELVAQTLWAAIHGVLALQIVKHDKGIPWRPIEERVDLVLEVLINGMRRR